jgi:lysophospholipase L1-like esterase
MIHPNRTLGPALLLLVSCRGAGAVSPSAPAPAEPAAEPSDVAEIPAPVEPAAPLGAALALEPRVLRIVRSSGPPSQSCAEALGPQPPTPPRPRPRSSGPRREPDLGSEIELDGRPVALRDLPGSDPAALPLQALEGSPDALAAIAEALQRATDGHRVRVSIFGDSHTSADLWTGHLRRRMQQRWGDAGHGFVLPAKLYRGARANDVNLCASAGWLPDWYGRSGGHGDGYLGFGGMSVSSEDPAEFGWLETTHSNPMGRQVAWYDLYTLGQPEGGSLQLVLDDVSPLIVSTRAERPELQLTRLEVPEGPHRLRLAPVGDGEVRIFGVSMERPGPGVIVDAIGIRGREARSWLGWEPEHLAAGLATLAPDLVVLAYGTNEANNEEYELSSYREDLDAVLGRLEGALPGTACVLVGPTDRFVYLGDGRYSTWERSAAIARIQRELALEHGCAFWDWQQASGGPGSMVVWHQLQPSLAQADGVHLTQRGYELTADRLLDALLAAGSP